MLEAIGITFLIGLVPPLRVAWAVTGVLRRAARRVRLAAAHDQASRVDLPHRAAPPRGVARRAVAPGARRLGTWPRAAARWARPSFNGLGSLGEGDRVHVVVRAGEATARA